MSWSDTEDGRERAILTSDRQPLLVVFEAPGGFFFLSEDGLRIGPYETRQGAEQALGWYLEDEYWNPAGEGA